MKPFEITYAQHEDWLRNLSKGSYGQLIRFAEATIGKEALSNCDTTEDAICSILSMDNDTIEKAHVEIFLYPVKIVE